MDETFSDDERQRLIALAMRTWAEKPDDAVRQIIKKLGGVDTVLIARRPD
jgi:hypothetical protein